MQECQTLRPTKECVPVLMKNKTNQLFVNKLSMGICVIIEEDFKTYKIESPLVLNLLWYLRLRANNSTTNIKQSTKATTATMTTATVKLTPF